MRRTDAVAAPELETLLDDAIFQRMEGDDRKPSPRSKTGQNPIKKMLKLAQLVVDDHAYGLKGACGRMVARRGAPFGRVGVPDYFRQLSGRLYGGSRARVHNGAGYASGLRIFAVFLYDPFQRGEVRSVDEGSRAFRMGQSLPAPSVHQRFPHVHAHVQRPVFMQTEAAFRNVQLERGNAQIQQGAVHLIPAQSVQSLLKGGIFERKEVTAFSVGGKTFLRPGKRLRITIQPAQLGRFARFFQQGGRVSGKTQSSVEITASGVRDEGFKHLAQQNGHMSCVFSSDSVHGVRKMLIERNLCRLRPVPR